jgi:hypothetical protein
MKAKDWRGLAYAVLAAQLPRLLGVALAAEGGEAGQRPWQTRSGAMFRASNTSS